MHTLRSRQGFTILEVAISIILVATAAGGLATSLLLSNSLSKDARDHARVLNSAVEELEYCRAAELSAVCAHLTGSEDVTLLDDGEIIARFAIPGLRGTKTLVSATTPMAAGDELAPFTQISTDPFADLPGTIRVFRMSTDPDSPRFSLIAIEVTCSWQGSSGKPQSLVLTGIREE